MSQHTDITPTLIRSARSASEDVRRCPGMSDFVTAMQKCENEPTACASPIGGDEKWNSRRQQIDLHRRMSGRLAVHLHRRGNGRCDHHVLALRVDDAFFAQM